MRPSFSWMESNIYFTLGSRHADLAVSSHWLSAYRRKQSFGCQQPCIFLQGPRLGGPNFSFNLYTPRSEESSAGLPLGVVPHLRDLDIGCHCSLKPEVRETGPFSFLKPASLPIFWNLFMTTPPVYCTIHFPFSLSNISTFTNILKERGKGTERGGTSA